MTRPEASRLRVQVYLGDPRVLAALTRDARLTGRSLSQSAAEALARGLSGRANADPEDRLLHLDRALRGHMRSTARDMAILQELLIELARAFFLRLPDAAIDEDPVTLAAVEHRIERLLDATAARLVAGGLRAMSEPSTPDPDRPGDPD